MRWFNVTRTEARRALSLAHGATSRTKVVEAVGDDDRLRSEVLRLARGT
jgi:hypothetical protein